MRWIVTRSTIATRRPGYSVAAGLFGYRDRDRREIDVREDFLSGRVLIERGLKRR
jgi:hypothetical protein